MTQQQLAAASGIRQSEISRIESDNVLARHDPVLAAGISRARLIVGFRNRLVHEYPQIDDEAVYSIAQHDVSGPLAPS